MDINRSKILKVLSSMGLAGLLLLGLALSLGLAQGPFTQTRVTTSSDGANRDSVDPSLSADGTKVAFTSDSDFLGQGILDDQFEIWLYDTTTMTLTRVTTSSDGANRGSFTPSLSADGTKVAFTSDSDFLGQGILDNQSEIWLYDTASMTLTRVTTAAGGANRFSNHPNLSADGTKVAFDSNSDFLGQGIPQTQTEIWLYDTTTMTLTRVTTSSPSGRYSFLPSLNENGTKMAFESDSDFLDQGISQFQWEVWLYDTTTMTVTRITTSSDGANRGSFTPSLSADGTKVAFYSDSDFLGQGIPQTQTEIWLYDTTTMTLTRVTTSGTNRDSGFPSLNAKGRKVAFYSDSDFLGQGIPQGQAEIWLYDTTTMTFTRVTTSSDGINRGSDFPSLNADGTKVAFQSDSDFLGQSIPDNQFEIWLFEAQAVLNLTKTVDDNNPEPGQGITYTVVVANSGLISATNLTISDTTPLSLTFINGSTTITPFGNGTTGDAPTLVNSLTLTAGEQVTVTYQVTVPTTLTNGEIITNTVGVTRPDMATPPTAATVITVSSLIIDPLFNTVYLPIILKN